MNKKILIIGGSSGLGKKLAELYAADGCQVGIVGRREYLLKEIREQFPGNIRILTADISHQDIDRQINEFIRSMDGVDIMIITASIVEFNKELSAEPELNTIATNISGFTRIINSAWHYFNKKGGGQIVAVTSIAAARGNKQAPAYNASKAYQSSYLEGLRLKAKHEKNNILFTELIPGYMDTAMGKGDRLFWVAPIDKAAHQAKKAIRKKRRRVFITKRWWLVYHIQRILPGLISDLILNSSWKLKRRI